MVPPAAGPLLSTSAPATSSPDGCRPIFVVDDDAVAQLLIGEALSSAGLVNPVVTSPDGRDAIAALRELARLGPAHVPALIFLDWQVPGCDGIEVLRWLRSTPGLELVPVVMLTGNDSAEQVMQAYDLGASSYLVKPLAFSALGETVRSMGLPWRLA
jgi:CheY-like chemotaxis protein